MHIYLHAYICMCVVSHSHGGFGGEGMKVVDGMHAGKSKWRCQSIFRVQVGTQMKPEHTTAKMRSPW